MTRLKLHAHDPGKSALFKIKQLLEKCPAVTKAKHMPIFSEWIIQLLRLK